MRPNFKNIDIKNAGFAATNAAEWAKANGIEANWKTPEHIEVKPVKILKKIWKVWNI
ncbi:MAG: hypothetical protein ACLRS8_18205 [Parabacteroides merdae]